MRQTDLSLEQLIAKFPDAPNCRDHLRTGGDLGLPSCFIINEIAEIFLGEGSDALRAEQKLVGLLQDEDDTIRWTAWKSLKRKTLVGSTREAVAAFEAEDRNSELILT